MKVTSLKKQSKKNQRKFHAAKRGTWNGVSPVPALCKASGFMIETVQSRRIVGMKISEAIVRSTKNRKLCNIFLGCAVTIKQHAAPTRKRIAENS